MSEFIYAFRVEPGSDNRDVPGGECTPLGLVFELVGSEATLRWTLNSGWVRRPVMTKRLLPGRQWRADKPGADYFVAQAFPEALAVRAVTADGDHHTLGREIEGYGALLLEAMFTDGTAGVFAILRELYALETA